MKKERVGEEREEVGKRKGEKREDERGEIKGEKRNERERIESGRETEIEREGGRGGRVGVVLGKHRASRRPPSVLDEEGRGVVCGSNRPDRYQVR